MNCLIIVTQGASVGGETAKLPAAFPSRRDGIPVYHASTSGLGHEQNSWTQNARYVTVDAL